MANFVTGGDCATIKDKALLTHLARGRFKVSHPLRLDVWILPSFWHALSSRSVAASTSSVVTWQHDTWVLDVARWLTAASSIAVGQAKKATTTRGVFCGCRAAAQSIHKRQFHLLIWARVEWTFPMGSRVRQVRMLVNVRANSNELFLWLDVLLSSSYAWNW